MRTFPRRSDNDAGTLAIAMLVMIAGVGLSAVMLTSVLQVVTGTRLEKARTVALQGARAGISSVLGNMRAAAVTDSLGVSRAIVDDLPCGNVTGKGATGTVDYTVTLTYLTQDPTGHDAAWIKANGDACATDVTGGVPAYAYVESVGTDQLTGDHRTLFGVYAFRRITNANLLGGSIKVWKNADDRNELCLDAGPAPMIGTVLHMRNCATDADGNAIDRQKFGYQPNLTISWIPADTGAYPNRLCVDAGVEKTEKTLMLQPCGTTTTLQQEWSFNFASGFFGTSDGVTLNNFCWSVKDNDTPGTTVTLNDTSGGNGNAACNTSYPNNYQSWNPSPDVGAGGAGAANLQLVNFAEFGRCLDVTYEDVTKPYEVVFQCKQSPTPDLQNNWNQTWHLPPDGTGAIYTHSEADGMNYCLTMPSVYDSPKLVTVEACSPALPATNQTWWLRGAAASDDEKYRIEGLGSWSGLCLASMTDQPAWQQAHKAGLQTCSDKPVQKWNVVSSLHPSGLSSIGER
jgi:hypothetical protein